MASAWPGRGWGGPSNPQHHRQATVHVYGPIPLSFPYLRCANSAVCTHIHMSSGHSLAFASITPRMCLPWMGLSFALCRFECWLSFYFLSVYSTRLCQIGLSLYGRSPVSILRAFRNMIYPIYNVYALVWVAFEPWVPYKVYYIAG